MPVGKGGVGSIAMSQEDMSGIVCIMAVIEVFALHKAGRRSCYGNGAVSQIQ